MGDSTGRLQARACIHLSRSGQLESNPGDVVFRRKEECSTAQIDNFCKSSRYSLVSLA